MRILTVLIFMLTGLMSSIGFAQEPKITVSAEQEEVIVGQPYLLRIEVLVPTFMPKAPVFPTFEVPSLIVRLPENDIVFLTEIFRENGKLAVSGTVKLCFLESEHKKRIPVPEFLIHALKPHFE